jgi:hypothetical protein
LTNRRLFTQPLGIIFIPSHAPFWTGYGPFSILRPKKHPL